MEDTHEQHLCPGLSLVRSFEHRGHIHVAKYIFFCELHSETSTTRGTVPATTQEDTYLDSLVAVCQA